MTITSYKSPGISSVLRIERFENHEPKQKANDGCRRNFDLDCELLAVGLLGVSDVRFYHRQGFEQNRIISIEKEMWPNHASLKNDMNRAGFNEVQVVWNDVFDYIDTLDDRSISALFLDLWGFAELCPNAKNKDRNERLERICPKLADDFHFMFTYEDQRSTSIWMQKAKEAAIDSDRSRYVYKVCSRLLEPRGVEVAELVSQKYPGLLGDGRTCRMVTSSFVGHPAKA